MKKLLMLILAPLAYISTTTHADAAYVNPTIECLMTQTQACGINVPDYASVAYGESCRNICDTCPTTGYTLPTGYVLSNGSAGTASVVRVGCATQTTPSDPQYGLYTYKKECTCEPRDTVVCNESLGYTGTPIYLGNQSWSGCTRDGMGFLPLCAKGKYYVEENLLCRTCPKYDSDGDGLFETVTTTELMGANSLTDCYVPKDIEFTNSAGTYTFTENCHHDGEG